MASIRAENLGKAYQFYENPLDNLKEWIWRRPYSTPFWALQNVNFTVGPGSSLGVVGDNGAGKSTLLKLLAGTIVPSAGKLERNGRVAAILELGSGFDPELSGRENIAIGCATVGLSPSETKESIPEIIAFSELGGFIDRPVKTYSTGMYARLGFSVAVSLDPEILVVDEALSVGDEHFRRKALNRMTAFQKRGRSLVFCTHNLAELQSVCERSMWLRKGKVEMLGATGDVLEAYRGFEKTARPSETQKMEQTARFGGETIITEVSLGGDLRNGAIETGGKLEVRVVARLSGQAQREGVAVAIVFHRQDGLLCFALNSGIDGVEMLPLAEDTYGLNLVIDDLPLLGGEYNLMTTLLHENQLHVYDYRRSSGAFKVVSDNPQDQGAIRVSNHWEAL